MRIILSVAIALALLAGGYWIYAERIANPRTVRELTLNPDSERAQRVMLLTLPGGRRIPVNYLREDDRVYAAADGTWWRDLVGDGFPVTLLVRGETLTGRARAIPDDPSYTERIFAKLRPDAIEGFGTLVEIQLGGSGGKDRRLTGKYDGQDGR